MHLKHMSGMLFAAEKEGRAIINSSQAILLFTQQLLHAQSLQLPHTIKMEMLKKLVFL